MAGRVELVFCRDPAASDAGSELAGFGQYAVALLYLFADNTVVLIDDRQHSVEFDFTAFHNDGTGDVFVAKGVFHGGNFGCIVVIHIFGKKIEP